MDADTAAFDTGSALGFYQSPDTRVSIAVDDPDGQSELKGGNTHPKQAVPERISGGQHAGHLQEGDGDMEGGAGKGNSMSQKTQRQRRMTSRMSRAITARMLTRNSVTGTG